MGVDINPARIAGLRAAPDSTREVTVDELVQARQPSYTGDVASQVFKIMNQARMQVCDSRVPLMGMTF